MAEVPSGLPAQEQCSVFTVRDTFMELVGTACLPLWSLKAGLTAQLLLPQGSWLMALPGGGLQLLSLSTLLGTPTSSHTHAWPKLLSAYQLAISTLVPQQTVLFLPSPPISAMVQSPNATASDPKILKIAGVLHKFSVSTSFVSILV